MKSRSFRLLPLILVSIFCGCPSAFSQDAGVPLLKALAQPLLRPKTISLQGGSGSRKAPNDVVSRNIARTRQEIERALFRDGTQNPHQRKPGPAILSLLKTLKTTAGTGSIAGTIYASDGVTPYTDYMSVTAYDLYGMYVGYGYTFGATGTYLISDLSAGDYLLQLSGMGEYVNTFYNGALDWGSATPVHVTDGQQTDGINFTLTHYPSGISGKVTDGTGAPLSDCAVFPYAQQNGNSISYAQTDSSGNYTIYLPPGTYRLNAIDWGSRGYAPQWYANATSFHSATPVQVAAQETTKGKDFSLSPGGALAGTVLVESGETIEPYSLSVTLESEDGEFYGVAQTDSAGSFFLSGLASGNYNVIVRYYGSLNLLDSWFGDALDSTRLVKVHITPPDTTRGVLFTLRRGGAISGTISGSLSTCVAVAYSMDRSTVAGAQTNAGGLYTILRLRSGSYKIYASPSNVYPQGMQQPVNQWYSAVMSFEAASVVTVHAPDTTKNINMTLQQGGGIMGSVSGPNGTPPDYTADVYAFSADGQLAASTTAQTGGNYALSGLPAGEYRLECGISRQSQLAGEWYDGAGSFDEASKISVTVGQTRTANFTLETAATINGYVVDTGGKRLTSDDHLLFAIAYTADRGALIGAEDVSFLGGFQGKILPRAIKMAIFNEYANWMTKQESLAVTYYPHGRSFADASTMALSLSPGATQSLGNFTVEKAGGAIAGTIYTSSVGHAATSGSYVIFTWDDKGYLAGASGYAGANAPLNGSYRVTGLRPGTYYLLAGFDPTGNGIQSAQWYDNISASLTLTTPLGSIKVPPGSKPVIVGEGTTAGIDFVFLKASGITESASIPRQFRLEQNYPNPFNPTTSIQFSIMNSQFTILTVHDLLGREVALLVNEVKAPGTYSVRFDGSRLASGVYFYRIHAGNFLQTKKLMMVR